MQGLELGESLGLGLVLGDAEDVEAHGLGERTALADGDLVSRVDAEGRTAVGGQVLVSLLVPVVLWLFTVRQHEFIGWVGGGGGGDGRGEGRRQPYFPPTPPLF